MGSLDYTVVLTMITGGMIGATTTRWMLGEPYGRTLLLAVAFILASLFVLEKKYREEKEKEDRAKKGKS